MYQSFKGTGAWIFRRHWGPDTEAMTVSMPTYFSNVEIKGYGTGNFVLYDSWIPCAEHTFTFKQCCGSWIRIQIARPDPYSESVSGFCKWNWAIKLNLFSQFFMCFTYFLKLYHRKVPYSKIPTFFVENKNFSQILLFPLKKCVFCLNPDPDCKKFQDL